MNETLNKVLVVISVLILCGLIFDANVWVFIVMYWIVVVAKNLNEVLKSKNNDSGHCN